MAHSAFGRNAGLSRERVRDLVTLDPEKFDRREYVALSWVRHLLTSPEGVPIEIEEEFQAAFTPREQGHIKASMKGMYCTNLLVNTQRYVVEGFTGSGGNGAPTVCEL